MLQLGTDDNPSNPSTVLALRANPPSPTRGEGKKAPGVLDSARLPAHVSFNLILEYGNDRSL
ncbi:hypothetical protein MES5069_910003 [Mesorhizobium escarrei]|uniref:Propionyl-coenzyme A carboxylase alpha polypeptide n=1 Tax=Mesorhizobium escarrei TaxID=666018 RepID=A0ABM9EJQ7_9HYPH|nr:hypothetical protein MES5069_910003 [Mesorhizobium escarrei]